MNLRQSRLADAIRRYASEDILTYSQIHEHSYGIISVNTVEVSTDYSYADIFVSSQENEKNLPKFLSPTELITKKRITKDFSLRKIPQLRYRVGKKKNNSNDILSLIQSLDKQYGLSSENSQFH
ncbi:MAG: hypothetical protein HHAS10_05550 [Candidatus Altimarinota bacterium]